MISKFKIYIYCPCFAQTRNFITREELEVEDVDTTPEALHFNLTQIPAHGYLSLDTVATGPVTTFTMGTSCICYKVDDEKRKKMSGFKTCTVNKEVGCFYSTLSADMYKL